MDQLLFIGAPEILIIVLVVLVLFGSKSLPEVARGLGKGMREFRRATDDIKRELNSEVNTIKDDIKTGTKEIDSGIEEIEKHTDVDYNED